MSAFEGRGFQRDMGKKRWMTLGKGEDFRVDKSLAEVCEGASFWGVAQGNTLGEQSTMSLVRRLAR